MEIEKFNEAKMSVERIIASVDMPPVAETGNGWTLWIVGGFFVLVICAFLYWRGKPQRKPAKISDKVELSDSDDEGESLAKQPVSPISALKSD